MAAATARANQKAREISCYADLSQINQINNAPSKAMDVFRDIQAQEEKFNESAKRTSGGGRAGSKNSKGSDLSLKRVGSKAKADRGGRDTTGPDDGMCVTCWSKRANYLFLPCQHCVVCEDCNPMLSQCPICRQAITRKIKCLTA